MSTTVKEIVIKPGGDNRHINAGFYGCQLTFVLRGEAGTVVFEVETNWSPLEVQKAQLQTHEIQPRPGMLGFHTPHRTFTIQAIKHPACPYVGDNCNVQSAYVLSKEIRDQLLSGGSEAVWQALERHYDMHERTMAGWREQKESSGGADGQN